MLPSCRGSASRDLAPCSSSRIRASTGCPARCTSHPSDMPAKRPGSSSSGKPESSYSDATPPPHFAPEKHRRRRSQICGCPSNTGHPYRPETNRLREFDRRVDVAARFNRLTRNDGLTPCLAALAPSEIAGAWIIHGDVVLVEVEAGLLGVIDAMGDRIVYGVKRRQAAAPLALDESETLDPGNHVLCGSRRCQTTSITQIAGAAFARIDLPSGPQLLLDPQPAGAVIPDTGKYDVLVFHVPADESPYITSYGFGLGAGRPGFLRSQLARPLARPLEIGSPNPSTCRYTDRIMLHDLDGLTGLPIRTTYFLGLDRSALRIRNVEQGGAEGDRHSVEDGRLSGRILPDEQRESLVERERPIPEAPEIPEAEAVYAHRGPAAPSSDIRCGHRSPPRRTRPPDARNSNECTSCGTEETTGRRRNRSGAERSPTSRSMPAKAPVGHAFGGVHPERARRLERDARTLHRGPASHRTATAPRCIGGPTHEPASLDGTASIGGAAASARSPRRRA